jgi:hypothetical protein
MVLLDGADLFGPSLEVYFLQIFVQKNFSCVMVEGLSKRYSFLDYGTFP